jgi:palmitoyltransferase
MASLESSSEFVPFDFTNGNPVEEFKKQQQTFLRESPNVDDLFVAVRHNNIAALARLVDKAGANIHVADIHQPGGYTAITQAAQNGSTQCTHFLLLRGANLNDRDDEGHTPLMWAAYNGHLSICMLLVSRGADKWAVDKDRRSALHWAAGRGQLDCVRLLAAKMGAMALVQRDATGALPIDCAHKSGDAATVAFLEQFARQFPADWGVRLTHPRETRGRNIFWTLPWLWHLTCCILFARLSIVPAAVIAGPVVYFGLRRIFGNSCLFDTTTNPWHMNVMLSTIGVAWIFYLGAGVFYQTSAVYPWRTLAMFVCTALALYYIYKSHTTDPGWITLDKYRPEEQVAMLSVSGDVMANDFCATCCLRRPMRSKHCARCDRCVTKFDHHCIWINQCVGSGNRIPFFLTVFFCWFLNIIYISLLYFTLFKTPMGATETWFAYLKNIAQLRPTLSYLLAFHFMHSFWLTLLVAAQFLLQLFNVTMNELMNRNKYRYMRDSNGGYRNPFNRGFFSNIREALSEYYGKPAVDYLRTFPVKSHDIV